MFDRSFLNPFLICENFTPMKILYYLYVIAATFQAKKPKPQTGRSLFYHDLLQISQEVRSYEPGDIQGAEFNRKHFDSLRNVLDIVSSLCLTQATLDLNFLYFLDFNLCDLNVLEMEALLSFQLFGDLMKEVKSKKISRETLRKEFMIKVKEIIEKIKTSESLIEKDVFNEIQNQKFTFIHLSWNVLVPSLMCYSEKMTLSYNDYALYVNVLNGSTIRNALQKPKDKPLKILSPSDCKLDGLKFIDHKDRYFFKYRFGENLENLENLKMIKIRCSIDIVDSFIRIFNLICKSYQVFLKISITYEDPLFMANIEVDKVSKEPTISNIKTKNESSLVQRASSFRSIRKGQNTIRRAKTSFFDYVRKSPAKESSPGSAKSNNELNNSGNLNNYNYLSPNRLGSPGNSLSPYRLGSPSSSGCVSPNRPSSLNNSACVSPNRPSSPSSSNYLSPNSSGSQNSSNYLTPIHGFPGESSSNEEENISCHNFFSVRSKSTISLNRSDSKVSLNSSRNKKESKSPASPKNDLSLIDDISIHSLITLSNIFMSFNKKAVILSTDNIFVEILVPKHCKKTDDFEIGRLYDFFNYRFNDLDVAKKVRNIENFTKKIVEASQNSDLEDFLDFITMANDGKDIRKIISFKDYIKIVGLTKFAIRFLDWYHLPIYEDTLDKILSAFRNKNKDLDKELANIKKIKNNIEKNKIKEEEPTDDFLHIKPDDYYYPFYVYLNSLQRIKSLLNEKRFNEILEETLIYLMYRKLITDKYKFTKTYKCLVPLLSTLFELLIFKIDFNIYLLEENVFFINTDLNNTNLNNTFNEKINLVDIIKDLKPIYFQNSKDDIYTVSFYSINKSNAGKFNELPYIAKPANFSPTIIIPEKVLDDIYDKVIVRWIERLDKWLFESFKN